jgi:hypothetical protein
MSVRTSIWIALFGAVGGAIGAGSYGWMHYQTSSGAMMLAAVGAIGGFIGGYMAACRLR